MPKIYLFHKIIGTATSYLTSHSMRRDYSCQNQTVKKRSLTGSSEDEVLKLTNVMSMGIRTNLKAFHLNHLRIYALIHFPCHHQTVHEYA